MTVTEIARAKINLFLHVGGVRADGLHDLFSVFVFADYGDLISLTPANDIELTIDGQFSEALKDTPPQDNLIWRAAFGLQELTGHTSGVAINLEKRLPIAAGIGGGSADAAAALRGLIRLWDLAVPADALHDLAFTLGADVPACLQQSPIAISGAGEIVNPGPVLGDFWVCLINPNIPMPTGPVFKAYDVANQNPPAPNLDISDNYATKDTLKELFAKTRNDLEAPARALAPVIDQVLMMLTDQPGAIAARMSGSGATCFGFFENEIDAGAAARAAEAKGWWSAAAPVCT